MWVNGRGLRALAWGWSESWGLMEDFMVRTHSKCPAAQHLPFPSAVSALLPAALIHQLLNLLQKKASQGLRKWTKWGEELSFYKRTNLKDASFHLLPSSALCPLPCCLVMLTGLGRQEELSLSPGWLRSRPRADVSSSPSPPTNQTAASLRTSLWSSHARQVHSVMWPMSKFILVARCVSISCLSTIHMESSRLWSFPYFLKLYKVCPEKVQPLLI